MHKNWEIQRNADALADTMQMHMNIQCNTDVLADTIHYCDTDHILCIVALPVNRPHIASFYCGTYTKQTTYSEHLLWYLR